MIEYFDGVRTPSFAEKSVHLFSKTLCATQAIASKLRLWIWFQTVGLPKGFHLPFSWFPLA